MAKQAPPQRKALSSDDTATHARLLTEVLAHPRDDGPRMVLADWLAEHDDPRGEFIVLQLALAKPVIGARAYVYRHRGEERTEQQDELEARVKRLLKQHQAEWLAPFRPYIRTWQWRRGFADWFEADAAKFLEGIAVTAKHTPIAHAKLTGMKKGVLAGLCARDELVHVESLDLHEQRIGPKDAPALGTARFAALRSLDLWGNPLGDAGLAAIIASPYLAGLEHLHLYKCGLTKASLVALSRAPCLASLQTLDLHELEGCDAEVGTLLARGEHLRKLRLGATVLTDEILLAIAGTPAFARLEELVLPNVSWQMQRANPELRDLHTVRGARAILESPHLRSLKRVVGLFEYEGTGPLGAKSSLAREFQLRFGEHVS
jgi:uncharacterized protein (TIGR02996 family)